MFVPATRTSQPFHVKEEDSALSTGLDELARQTVASLEAESWPSDAPLKTPQEVFKALLAKSTAIQKGQGRTQADHALQTTRAALVAMRNGSTAETDELLQLMVQRELKQAAEVQKLIDKAPSKESRLATMKGIQAEFGRTLTAQADARTAGAAKGAERVAARLKVANQLLVAATRLQELALEAGDHLHSAHGVKTEGKDEQGQEVWALLDDRIAEIESEDVILQDATTESDTETPIENERNEALRLKWLLERQLEQLQQAAAAHTTAAQAEAAEAAAPPAPQQ